MCSYSAEKKKCTYPEFIGTIFEVTQTQTYHHINSKINKRDIYKNKNTACSCLNWKNIDDGY